MDENPQETTGPNAEQDLASQIARLTQRVFRLESALRARGISIDEPSPRVSVSARELAPGITHWETAPPPRQEAPRANASPASPQFVAQQSNALDRSLENRIGSQWFNRIGILAVLIGMAWFLKLAIDNHWIGPAARVLIGIAAGVALIAWSERFRSRGFAGFSFSLKAIGTSLLYLSLWAAFSVFHLIPAFVAFVAMVLITGFNGYMAWTQNSKLLALYALVGGYITPLLLSTGENHQAALFTYLLVLNLATLALSVLRPWSNLLAAGFAGTVFYFAAWALSYYTEQQFAATAFFLAIFFLLFALAPRLNRASSAEANIFVWDVLPFMNAALGFLGFFIMLDSPAGDGAQSWAAALFALFFFSLMRLPSHFVGQGGREGSLRMKGYDLLIAVSFLAVAIERAVHHFWWHVQYDGVPAHFHEIGIYAQFTYSACFMIFGAALLVIGFTRRISFLRWQALAVLAITVAKVFLVDISQLNEGYRVLSFLGLGTLLLAISFVYQRDWLNLRRQAK